MKGGEGGRERVNEHRNRSSGKCGREVNGSRQVT